MPSTIPGALPENGGFDPGDVNRTASENPRDATERLVAFLNRVVMLEEQSIAIKEDLLGVEADDATRSRIQSMIDEDRRAIEVTERAIRDLGGKTSAFRKTGGRLVGKARFIVEGLPARAKNAIQKRDWKAAREVPPYARMVDYADAYVAELAGHAHWQVLKRIGETTGTRAVLDAVNECEAVADAHVDYFKSKTAQVARDAFEVRAPPARL